MKFLLLSPTAFRPPSQVGGGERYVTCLAQALAGQELVSGVTLLSFHDRSEQIDHSEGKLRQIVAPARFHHGNPVNPFLPLKFLCSKLDFDYLYLHQFATWLTPGAVVWKTIRKVPLLLTDHNGGGATYNRPLGFDMGIDLFLTTSALSADVNSLRAKNQATIYGGVDTEFFTPARVVASDAPARAPKRGLLFVGRAHSIKGILELLDVIKKSTGRGILTLALSVVSEAEKSYYQKIQASVADLTQSSRWRIDIHLNSDKEKLRDLYRAHACTVLPSLPQFPYESLGLTPLESLACGTPAVVSSSCGIAELAREHGKPFFQVASDWQNFVADFAREEAAFAEHETTAAAWARAHASWDQVARRVLAAVKKI